MRIVYECLFDTQASKVTSVRVRPGVLGKASAVPGATIAPAAGRRPAASAGTPQAQAAPMGQQPTGVDMRRIREPSDIDVNQIPPGAKPPAPAAATQPAGRQ